MSNNDDSFHHEEDEVIQGESELLLDLGKGLAAGFVGTIAVAILVVLKNVLGLAPEADPIGILGGIMGGTWAGTGWVILFVGGALLGIGFASLDSHVEHVTGAGEIVRGGLFGFLLSVVLMLLYMGVSGGTLGTSLAVVIIVTNIAYGMVTGAVYSSLNPETVVT